MSWHGIGALFVDYNYRFYSNVTKISFVESSLYRFSTISTEDTDTKTDMKNLTDLSDIFRKYPHSLGGPKHLNIKKLKMGQNRHN